MYGIVYYNYRRLRWVLFFLPPLCAMPSGFLPVTFLGWRGGLLGDLGDLLGDPGKMDLTMFAKLLRLVVLFSGII